jgi:hypothetical protein
MAQSGEPASTISISITIRGDGVKSEGEIRIDDEPTRRLGGSTCATVVEGLALVAALMLESNAGKGAPPSPRSEEPVPTPVGAPPASTHPEATPDGQPPRNAGWATGLGFATAVYAAPTLLVGASGFVEIALGAPLPWRPTLRGSLVGMTTGIEPLGSAAARFMWLGVRLEGCPIVARRGGVSLFPCIHLEAGQMTANGLAVGDVVEPRTSHGAWAAAGIDVRVRLPITGPLFAELEGGVSAPLVRRSYVFDNPKEVVHTTPWVALSSRLGLAIVPP